MAWPANLCEEFQPSSLKRYISVRYVRDVSMNQVEGSDEELWLESGTDDEDGHDLPDELYDASMDDRDQQWVDRQRSGRRSDAILSCPGAQYMHATALILLVVNDTVSTA
jgi:hypothetical protein